MKWIIPLHCCCFQIVADVFNHLEQKSTVVVPAFGLAMAIRGYELIVRAGLTTSSISMVSNFSLDDASLRAVVLSYEVTCSLQTFFISVE